MLFHLPYLVECIPRQKKVDFSMCSLSMPHLYEVVESRHRFAGSSNQRCNFALYSWTRRRSFK